MAVAIAMLLTSMVRSPEPSLRSRRSLLLWRNSIETDVASFPPTPVAGQRQLVAYWQCCFITNHCKGVIIFSSMITCLMFHFASQHLPLHQDTDCVIRVTAATPRRQSNPTPSHTFRARHKVPNTIFNIVATVFTTMSISVWSYCYIEG